MSGTFKREITSGDLERMSIPKRYWNVTFEGISGGPHLEKIVSYVKKLDEMRAEGAGLLLWGDNGVGKTGIAVVIAKEYRRRGNTVYFLEYAGLRDSVIRNEMFDSSVTCLERAKTVDVLVLDDVGKGREDTRAYLERLFDEIIRVRNSRKLVTIMTTNMDPYAGGKTGEDGVIGSQLGDKLKKSTMHSFKECIFPVFVDGADYRDLAASRLSAILVS